MRRGGVPRQSRIEDGAADDGGGVKEGSWRGSLDRLSEADPGDHEADGSVVSVRVSHRAGISPGRPGG